MEDIATYLGPKGYSIKKEHLTIQEQELIRKELTVKAFVPKTSLSKPEPFHVYRESPNKIYVPRFYGIDTYGEPDAIKISDGEDTDVNFEGELRDFQKPIVKKYIECAKTKGGGLLEIHCGAGKTVMALKIISELKKKTLVIVHKEFLLQQWTERINQFLPTAKVGKIQGDMIDVEGKDIVIGMLQSISMKNYPTSLFQNFGLTILDECFPYKTYIHTDKGLIKIGSLYEKWINKDQLPEILSFNQKNKKFEYKKMTHAWRKERKDLIKIKMSKRVINCTPEHKILTINGYTEANKLKEGDLIVSKYDRNNIENIISPAINSGQLQSYGLLKVSSISYFKNNGDNRCKKPYVYDIEVEDNHNFVIGSESLDNPQYIDGPVVSNCHHMAAAVFSNALFKIVTKHMLGLSATMNRKDKLSFVFKMFIGDVVYKKEREGDDVVVVKGINYEVDDYAFEKVDKMYNGQTNYSGMIKKLCEFEKRSDFILKVLDDSLKEKPEQQFIVLAHNKSILKYLHDSIQEKGLHTVGYYIGGMKQKELKISETKKIIIATYAMAEEALDIKTLTSLLMATPKTDVRQAVGRILRKKKSNALVFDIIDTHGLFQRQWKKRCTWYRKQKYTVLLANNELYNKNMWVTLTTNGQRLKHKTAPDQFEKLLQGVCLIK
jgi:superfamily II DNA or RNA helicase